jgi:hypothetical protein
LRHHNWVCHIGVYQPLPLRGVVGYGCGVDRARARACTVDQDNAMLFNEQEERAKKMRQKRELQAVRCVAPPWQQPACRRRRLS